MKTLLTDDYADFLPMCIQVLVNECGKRDHNKAFFICERDPNLQKQRNHMWRKVVAAMNALTKVPATRVMMCMEDTVFGGAYVYIAEDSQITLESSPGEILMRMPTTMPIVTVCNSSADLQNFTERCGGMVRPKRPDPSHFPDSQPTGGEFSSPDLSRAPPAPSPSARKTNPVWRTQLPSKRPRKGSLDQIVEEENGGGDTLSNDGSTGSEYGSGSSGTNDGNIDDPAGGGGGGNDGWPDLLGEKGSQNELGQYPLDGIGGLDFMENFNFPPSLGGPLSNYSLPASPLRFVNGPATLSSPSSGAVAAAAAAFANSAFADSAHASPSLPLPPPPPPNQTPPSLLPQMPTPPPSIQLPPPLQQASPATASPASASSVAATTPPWSASGGSVVRRLNYAPFAGRRRT